MCLCHCVSSIQRLNQAFCACVRIGWFSHFSAYFWMLSLLLLLRFCFFFAGCFFLLSLKSWYTHFDILVALHFFFFIIRTRHHHHGAFVFDSSTFIWLLQHMKNVCASLSHYHAFQRDKYTHTHSKQRVNVLINFIRSNLYESGIKLMRNSVRRYTSIRPSE